MEKRKLNKNSMKAEHSMIAYWCDMCFACSGTCTPCGDHIVLSSALSNIRDLFVSNMQSGASLR